MRYPCVEKGEMIHMKNLSLRSGEMIYIYIVMIILHYDHF